TCSAQAMPDFAKIAAKAGEGWKSEFFKLCQQAKIEIEKSRDAELIRSSIAVSHFNNIIKDIANYKDFTQSLAEDLKNAFKAKEDYEQGKYPQLCRGKNNIIFKRFQHAK